MARRIVKSAAAAELIALGFARFKVGNALVYRIVVLMLGFLAVLIIAIAANAQGV